MGESGEPPCAIVIFGASGDLTRRKLGPALARLAAAGRLPPGTTLLGYARSPLTGEQFARQIGLAPSTPAHCVHYIQGDYADLQASGLPARLAQLGHSRLLFHLATPPAVYLPIVRQLAGLAPRGGPGDPASDGGWRRIVIEKPFGQDLDSARQLNRELLAAFGEEQIFRIDHYLGKEAVQNILMLRFANIVFEPVWNHRYIDHIQITAAETLGLEHRGGYYDRAGALRDMVQNHLLQLLTLVAMEPPATFEADAVRDEKAKVLRSLRRIDPAAVPPAWLRGQYEGYRREPGVAADSNTESYVALRLHVDNWRWAGVPFYLRTGKRLAARTTEIAVSFKPVPHTLIRDPGGAITPNLLTLSIQPEPGIGLRFESKFPGLGLQLRPVRMAFQYDGGENEGPSDYEILLLEVLRGEHTLFTRGDEVLEAWRLLEPLLRARTGAPAGYAPGSAGPEAADAWIAATGRSWHRL